MDKPYLRLHRLFLSQSLYPILLSSMLAFTIYLGRVFFSSYWRVYANLNWNLLLAWIPYAFSMLATALHRQFPRRWWLLILPAGVWLAFYPNAAYIVTDFLHLAPRRGIPIWYDIMLLATFSWTGVFLAIVSLQTMQKLVRVYLGGMISWLFVACVLGLGGLGIYLGRFERWNSWDLLFQPQSILKDVLLRFVNPFSNLGFFGFTILFTAFLLVCYITFISMSHSAEADE